MENVRTTTISAKAQVAPRSRRRDERPVAGEPAAALEKARHSCVAVRRSSLFLRVSRIIKQSLELEGVLQPLADCLGLTLGFRRVETRVLEPEGGALESAYLAGSGRSGGGDLGGLADLREWVERTGKPAATLGEAEGTPGVTLLCVPVLVAGRVAGTLFAERVIDPEKPVNEDLDTLTRVAAILAQAVLFRRSLMGIAGELHRENHALREHIHNHFRPAGMVGDSHAMQRMYYRIIQAAPLELSVLVAGEKGAGKNCVARALHAGSARSEGPLVEVDCAELRGPRIIGDASGSELEGFVKKARGGTLFLERVEALAPADQARLLGLLDIADSDLGYVSEAVGEDIRVICATGASLEELVDQGRFCKELFQILSAYTIRIPSLRERRGDLLQLADYFVEKFATHYHKKIQRVSAAAVDLLMAYDWPGNVGEMCELFEKAVASCGDGVIRANHFPPRLYAAVDPQGAGGSVLECAVAALEYELVVDALIKQHGNIAAAARQLGTTERIMGCRVKKYGLDMSRFTGISATSAAA
ncbi:MAG: sigma 54-interacting transcriptional regulator [Chthoniobacteraceae bacterium]